jgi:hypothetical protein
MSPSPPVYLFHRGEIDGLSHRLGLIDPNCAISCFLFIGSSSQLLLFLFSRLIRSSVSSRNKLERFVVLPRQVPIDPCDVCA